MGELDQTVVTVFAVRVEGPDLERTTGHADLLDSDQVVAACAAVCLSGARAVAWDLDANPTTATLVATCQHCPDLVICHFRHPNRLVGN